MSLWLPMQLQTPTQLIRMHVHLRDEIKGFAHKVTKKMQGHQDYT